MAFRVVECCLVFRVREDHLQRDRLETGERLLGAVLAPGLEEEMARLVARRIEHPIFPSSSCREIRTGRGSGTPGSRACARGRHSDRAGSHSEWSATAIQ